MTEFHDPRDPDVITATAKYYVELTQVERQLEHAQDALAKENLIQCRIHAETAAEGRQPRATAPRAGSTRPCPRRRARSMPESAYIPDRRRPWPWAASATRSSYNAEGLVSINCPLHGLLSDEAHQTEAG